MKKAAPDTASQLLAMVTADLDKKIFTHRKLAAWFALITEARSKPAYLEMAWERDAKYRSTLASICELAKEEGDYAFDPQSTADAIYAMQEGLVAPDDAVSAAATSARRRSASCSTRCARFSPRHFAQGGMPLKTKAEDQQRRDQK